MHLEHERNYALGMDALLTPNRIHWNTGPGCTDYRMLLEHERNYALGMDALRIDALEHEQN